MFEETSMHHARRKFIRQGSALLTALAAAGWMQPGVARAEEWNRQAFEARTLEDLVRLLGGTGPEASGAITIVAPDIAENGAVVPVGIVSEVPGTDAIALLVEKNPNVLAAMYTIPQHTLADVQTRVKMAQTSNVFALVRAEGRYFFAAKEIKITLGGCGG
jgi:sulfur-oxidizing protein SoxY